MKILTIDTSRDLCASLIKDTTSCHKIIDYISRGHAERLIPQIKELLETSELNINDIKLCAVNTGPGSFTGVRIGVAATRAFALSLNIQTIGVNMFSALAHIVISKVPSKSKKIIVLLKAHTNSYYYNFVSNTEAMYVTHTNIIDEQTLIEILNTERPFIIGDNADIFGTNTNCDYYIASDEEILYAIDAIAREAITKPTIPDYVTRPATPLYIIPYKTSP